MVKENEPDPARRSQSELSQPPATSTMAESSSRPRVFLDVQCGAEFFGRICLELFNDKTPKTCEKCVALFSPHRDEAKLT